MASMTSAFVLNWFSLNWISTSVEYTKAAIWTLPVNKPVLTYTYAHTKQNNTYSSVNNTYGNGKTKQCVNVMSFIVN